MQLATLPTIDYFLTNHAPDCDACTIRVETTNSEFVVINIWREEDQSVSVKIKDSDDNRHDLVLGEASTTSKL